MTIKCIIRTGDLPYRSFYKKIIAEYRKLLAEQLAHLRCVGGNPRGYRISKREFPIFKQD